jgi:hypothetical protein
MYWYRATLEGRGRSIMILPSVNFAACLRRGGHFSVRFWRIREEEKDGTDCPTGRAESRRPRSNTAVTIDVFHHPCNFAPLASVSLVASAAPQLRFLEGGLREIRSRQSLFRKVAAPVRFWGMITPPATLEVQVQNSRAPSVFVFRLRTGQPSRSMHAVRSHPYFRRWGESDSIRSVKLFVRYYC